jgi:dienelactone hydrolase
MCSLRQFGIIASLAVCRCAFGETPGCPAGVFLAFEAGRLAAVNWVEHSGNRIHSRVIHNRSQIIDAVIDLRSDGTAAHSSVTNGAAGQTEEPRKTESDFAEGSVYWSPRIPSSIEHAVGRARMLGKGLIHLPGASLYNDSRSDITVERVSDRDWVLRYQDKKYLVLTDEKGCMISAALPDYGVTIEWRAQFRAADYVAWPPYGAPPEGSYRAIEVSIPAPQGHVLSGTLTIPAGKDNVPAAVLITGLSPHERNNGEPPWMPLRDIADFLTRAGIAVLRVDDRGVGKSTGDKTTYTTFDKAEDVRTEVAWLRARPGIDRRRIMLVGYSEGGLIGPMVAAKDPSIAAVVTLAGPGVPGMEVARYQVEQPILKDASIPAAEKGNRISEEFSEAMKDLSAHERSFLSIDPESYDRQVRCPALIIHGGADATVPVRSAERIAAAMRAGGNRDVTVRIYPGISHALLPDPVGLASGWSALPAFLTAPEVLDEIARWSVARLVTN